MAKIAVLLENMFEDVEYTKPEEAYKKAGHQITLIGVQKGKIVKGKKLGTEVRIEKTISDVSVDDFDALFIPGGYSPDKLRAYDDIVKFVKQFSDKKKLIFFICHGAQLLITAKALEGRKVTGWRSIKQDILYSGAKYINKEVVEDDNFISSRQPSDIPSFIEATLNRLKLI
jgi:protease I